ncbi:WD40 repeat-like protein [Suhomyces tanzawaensis NRRL Y-17324]|uniref:Pre-mRNA-processing factor 17 n=1 Tax=Suhomyces tanzawaensis NRRL Y-17324 TaxID=984487 RepID=A0A1E4SFJ2_9ASCO|nr:WD40 repeat-like protein [Suhomyces tanzawaensis NRRL Y-17324]ODV78278.1 WD40 repeat-like protein [Suhomyces tanzawaensis NRRL Y-17324]
MLIVQGYESSDGDESDKDRHESLAVGVITEQSASPIRSTTNKLKRTFAGSIEQVHYDAALFKSTSTSQDRSQAKKLKRARKKNKDDYLGPWAAWDQSEPEPEHEQESNEAHGLESDKENDRDAENEENVDEDDLDDSSVETTQFFGTKKGDYLGRSYLHVPTDVNINLKQDPGSHQCFVPKKLEHTFAGHSKGINKLELFPRSGHLMLSAGNDPVIRLWDMYHDRELLREYYGHKQAVKDVVFNKIGDKFLSCGYDKLIHLWNTESGKIEKTIRVKAIPNVIKFNPNNEAEFIVGLSNHNIEHYDMSTLSYEVPIQTYDHHLGAINSLTIIDDEKRFISTADDKTVRFWDWQINIPIKFISDPSQHSMPTSALYPGGAFVALQSMDNTIQTIQGRGKFRTNNKTFRGHNVAGYGIDIDFSPDGKLIVSGDSKGNSYFWDWKTCKLVKKLKVSTRVISSIKFHPQEPSGVVMGGMSGEIYYYA